MESDLLVAQLYFFRSIYGAQCGHIMGDPCKQKVFETFPHPWVSSVDLELKRIAPAEEFEKDTMIIIPYRY